MKTKILIIFLFVTLLFLITFSGPNDKWITCCESDCDYSPDPSKPVKDNYYCCPDGWREGGCNIPKKENCTNGIDDDGDSLIDCNDPDCTNDPACQRNCNAANSFSSRCPTESTSISLTCPSGQVCIYTITNAFVCDNTNKSSNIISSGYYCIDKKPPYFVSIEHFPELISIKDDTYDPYPNYFIDWNGNSISLSPNKVVIDKEYVNFIIKSRDEYNGREISGVSYSSASFNLSSDFSSTYFSVSSCPGGGNYNPPATHNARFRNLNVGWGKLSTSIYDQARNSNSNSRYQIYVFLGARGDQNNQTGTDKIVFLKTYWDPSNEVRTKTKNLGGNYFKNINCFGYSSKCIQIRDIIGKTDEFADCLWVGPSSNPKNVRIYNFKEGVDLEKNTKVDYRICTNPNYCNTKPGAPIFVYPEVDSQIAFCSKNDTGILVDLPNLVSENIPNGFQILPSTKERFSVIWQVKYAREQREVAAECYLNPTMDGQNACTIDDIINGNCQITTGQPCKCSEGFPCKQDTSLKTIHSCTVDNPRYFIGTNRIICKFYDPRDLGIRAEVWFNHDFFFDGKKIYKNLDERFFDFIFKPIELIKFIFNL